MNLSILNYRIDVFRVSSEAVVVEAITHYEVVGNLFAAITDVEFYLQFAWLEQERADVNALGVLLLKCVEHVSHREASIDDVLDDNDRPSCDVDVKPNHFANADRRVRGASVAATRTNPPRELTDPWWTRTNK